MVDYKWKYMKELSVSLQKPSLLPSLLLSLRALTESVQRPDQVEMWKPYLYRCTATGSYWLL